MGSTKTSRTCRLRGPRRPRQATTRPSKFTRRAKTPGCRRRPAPWTSSGRACTSTPRATKRQRSPFSRCMTNTRNSRHMLRRTRGPLLLCRVRTMPRSWESIMQPTKTPRPGRSGTRWRRRTSSTKSSWFMRFMSEIAVDEYIKNGVTDVAQRYLDVWWAFYVGSQEYGSGDGYCPYALAEKRSKFFKTDTAMIGNGGTSKVNDILLKATMEISKRMRGAGNNDKIKNIMKCVRAQLKVPLIQGCIQYGYKTDPATAFEPSTSYDSVTGYNSEHARKGELLSFCSGVLPFLHQADPAKAAALLTAVDVKTMADRYPQWQDVKAVFDGATLNKMGVKCSDIGGFADKNADKTSATTLGSDFTACSDGSLNNADADSGQYVGDWAVGNNVADTKGGVKPENTVPSPVAGSAGATTPHFFPLLVASFVISRIFWHGVF